MFVNRAIRSISLSAVLVAALVIQDASAAFAAAAPGGSSSGAGTGSSSGGTGTGSSSGGTGTGSSSGGGTGSSSGGGTGSSSGGGTGSSSGGGTGSSSGGGTGSSSGGSSGSGSSSGGGGGGGAVNSSVFNRNPPSIADVKPETRSAETAISICSGDDPRCIADALDNYAEALRQLPLPPELKHLPDVVARAAHQVRAAKTRAQAVKAIKVAIAEVHRSITLLKADDPIVLKAETREGAFIAETLEVADNKLEKAVGL